MKKIIHKGKEARALLRTGVNFAADSVAFTLGPMGRNVAIARQSTSPKITNDGSTILQSIKLDDPTEQMGVDFIKEASRLVELEAFDGTTTVSLITRKLINDCLDKVDEGSVLGKNSVSPMDMKRKIDNDCAIAVEEIKKLAKKISSREYIMSAAMVSVENEHLAKIITDIFLEIGKEGIILVEEGGKDTEYEIVRGMEIPSGLFSEHYGEEIKIKNAKILVSNDEIKDISTLVPIMNKLVDEGIGELVIFAKSFSKEILDIFIKMKITGEFTVIPIKSTMPDKNWQQHDIASLSGAIIMGQTHKLGEVGTFIADKDKAVFVDGRGDVSQQVKRLNEELKSVKAEFDKEIMQKRISSLSGGVAVIKVGANSQVEKGYLQDKLDDAVQSVRGAIRDGVVPGRGETLRLVAESMPGSILAEAFKEPARQIQINGVPSTEDNIIDGVPVVLSCVKTACSVAGVVITTEMTVAFKENEEQKTEE